jgi:hypothetical protein
MTTPAYIDLAQYMGSAVAGLVYTEGPGGNIFIDDLPDAPNEAVGVYTQGGPEADSKNYFDEPHVQIIVRGDSGAVWAPAMCATLYSALHGLNGIVLPSGAYLVSCVGVQSSPTRLGPDSSGRYRYSMNFRLEVENATAFRPTA